MTDISASNVMAYSPMRVKDSFYEALEEPDRLKDLEDFLNGMGIICKLVLKKLPDGQRELYFSHEKLVSFYETASSGTLALVDMYRRLIPKHGLHLLYIWMSLMHFIIMKCPKM